MTPDEQLMPWTMLYDLPAPWRVTLRIGDRTIGLHGAELLLVCRGIETERLTRHGLDRLLTRLAALRRRRACLTWADVADGAEGLPERHPGPGAPLVEVLARIGAAVVSSEVLVAGGNSGAAPSNPRQEARNRVGRYPRPSEVSRASEGPL